MKSSPLQSLIKIRGSWKRSVFAFTLPGKLEQAHELELKKMEMNTKIELKKMDMQMIEMKKSKKLKDTSPMVYQKDKIKKLIDIKEREYTEKQKVWNTLKD